MRLFRPPDFETRLIFAICVLASAVVHAMAVFLYYTPKQIPDAVTLEFIQDTPAPEPEAGLGAAGLPTPEPGAAAGAAAAPEPEATGWRARWRAREARFEADARVHEANVALLDQSLDAARGPAGDEGDARPLALCDGPRPRPLDARAERDVSHWGGLVPTGLFRAAYMEGMTQVRREGVPARDRLGAMEFALPPRLARVPLDEPENAVVEVGRADVRCLIGVSYSEGIFPIVLRGLPARLAVDGEVREALVDVRLNQDGTFAVEDREGSLGVRRGAVYNHEAVGRKLRTFYSGASIFLPR